MADLANQYINKVSLVAWFEFIVNHAPAFDKVIGKIYIGKGK